MKNKLYIASGNLHKVKELQHMLKDMNFEVFGLNDIPNYVSPEETGDSFIANAFIKAQTLRNHFINQNQIPPYILADDSGIESEDLQGQPGIYSARFAGENATDEENNQKLIALIQGIKNPSRKAHYVCALVWLTPKGQKIEIQETCEGTIQFNPQGQGGFGYDPYIYIDNFHKTMAELTPEEKNSISHRGKALRKLISKLNH